MIAFDTETTGLCNTEAISVEKQPKIIEFAAVKFDEKFKELDRLEFLCHPGIEISREITNITGITNDMLKGEKPFSSNLDKLNKFFLGEEILFGHNLAFDVNLLRYELIRLDRLTKFPWPPIQICSIERTMHIRGHRLSLTKLHEHYTKEPHTDGAHRAVNDVLALITCLKHMHKDGLINEIAAKNKN